MDVEVVVVVLCVGVVDTLLLEVHVIDEIDAVDELDVDVLLLEVDVADELDVNVLLLEVDVADRLDVNVLLLEVDVAEEVDVVDKLDVDVPEVDLVDELDVDVLLLADFVLEDVLERVAEDEVVVDVNSQAAMLRLPTDTPRLTGTAKSLVCLWSWTMLLFPVSM